MKKIAVSFLVGVAVSAALTFFATKSALQGTNSVEVVTYTVHDTTVVYEPKIVEKKVVSKEYVAVHDTLWQHDTLLVVLEREQIVAEDSTYRVVASGIRPSIDSVTVYGRTVYETQYVYREQKRKRWAIGPQAGAGIGKDGLTYYFGAGVTFILWEF